MIIKQVLKYKILQYCIDTIFDKINNNIFPENDKLIIGKKYRMVISKKNLFTMLDTKVLKFSNDHKSVKLITGKCKPNHISNSIAWVDVNSVEFIE